MSWHYQFQLPEGVKPDDPEAAELLAKIKALKPLPPKLTVREQLAVNMIIAYSSAKSAPAWSDVSDLVKRRYLAEADAAIEFFSQLVRDAEVEVRIEEPTSSAGRAYNGGVTDLTNTVLKRLSE